ncbi:hypothetical protein HN011_002900 [Eciton burchellii]|nr:hypothetical protein HN011_002900 [Eciton burchellii]
MELEELAEIVDPVKRDSYRALRSACPEGLAPRWSRCSRTKRVRVARGFDRSPTIFRYSTLVPLYYPSNTVPHLYSYYYPSTTPVTCAPVLLLYPLNTCNTPVCLNPCTTPGHLFPYTTPETI